MRTLFSGMILMALAGCGVDETVYVPEYADLYCQTVMDCTDPAVLTFDGISNKDDCLAIVGPDVDADIANCDYNPKQAKQCLKQMELMGCPGEGQTVDDILPLECAQATSACTTPKTEPTGTTGTGTTTTTTGGSGA